MFSQIGPLELIVVLLIVLVIFGPKRLPMLGRQLGRGMREFKESITGRDDDEHDDEGQVAPRPAALAPAVVEPPASAKDKTPPPVDAAPAADTTPEPRR
jgi:sec-independent protein translocase protein TatA